MRARPRHSAQRVSSAANCWTSTIGIIGIGNVGGRLAELCRGLFRMRVLAYDPYLSAAADRGAKGRRRSTKLDDLLRQADYVSVNCPLTRETTHMMGAREFALMQPHAYFITTARGCIHDEDALAEALAAKQIAGAGLDVWEDEPPPHDHRLMAFDNVLVSPHTPGATVELRENMARFAAEQLIGISGWQAAAAADPTRRCGPPIATGSSGSWDSAGGVETPLPRSERGFLTGLILLRVFSRPNRRRSCRTPSPTPGPRHPGSSGRRFRPPVRRRRTGRG